MKTESWLNEIIQFYTHNNFRSFICIPKWRGCQEEAQEKEEELQHTCGNNDANYNDENGDEYCYTRNGCAY